MSLLAAESSSLFSSYCPPKTVAYLLRVFVSLPQICPHLSTSFHKFASLPSTVSSVPTLQTRLHVCFWVHFSLTHPPYFARWQTVYLQRADYPLRLRPERIPRSEMTLRRRTVTLQSAAGASVENWFTRMTSRCCFFFFFFSVWPADKKAPVSRAL